MWVSELCWEAGGVCTLVCTGWGCLHTSFHQAGGVCTPVFTRLGMFAPCWGCLYPGLHGHTAPGHTAGCAASSSEHGDTSAGTEQQPGKAPAAAQGSFLSKQEALPWRHCLLQPGFLLGVATPWIQCAGCPAEADAQQGGQEETLNPALQMQPELIIPSTSADEISPSP